MRAKKLTPIIKALRAELAWAGERPRLRRAIQALEELREELKEHDAAVKDARQRGFQLDDIDNHGEAS